MPPIADGRKVYIGGKCKHCRYWDWGNDQECGIAEWLESPTEKMAGSRVGFYATAADDYGLRAGVKTGPDFGCINFKERG